MPPKFIFFRHGEATHNLAFHNKEPDAFTSLVYKDPPLTEEGKNQVRKKAEELVNYKILDLWSSSLTRCIETSLELFEEINVNDLYLHDNLMEIAYKGQVCNLRKTKKELKMHYNGLFKMESLPDSPCAWDTDETSYSSTQRMFMFLKLMENIYEDEKDDTYILIVSHQNIMAPFVKKHLNNAEYHIMSINDIFAD